VDAVELGAGGGDLLDAQLAQLSLELTELLDELVLVLGPQGTGLNLGGRLRGEKTFLLAPNAPYSENHLENLSS